MGFVGFDCRCNYIKAAAGVAVVTVTFLGFGMLFGHLDRQTAARVVLDIFIPFGAPMFARELTALARDGEASELGQFAADGLPQQPTVPKNAPVAIPMQGRRCRRISYIGAVERITAIPPD